MTNLSSVSIQGQLPSPDRCTGCSACADLCPGQHIQISENLFGETLPVVDSLHCTRCGLCVKSCPVNHPPKLRYPEKAFACWSTDPHWRKKSATGGIGTRMAEFVIARQGVVYGAQYDETMQPVCRRATTSSEIEQMRGSKYAQMAMRHAYQAIAADVRNGVPVLFVGTPCQVAGVRAYLKGEYSNLILVDLICHGVAPGRYLAEEIDLLKKKHGFQHISDCRFRGNDRHNFAFTLWDDETLLYRRPAWGEYYFHAFLSGVTLRECCYRCPYAQGERAGDFTIGDFFGIGKFKPFPYPIDNVSLVSVNTAGKASFLEQVFAQSADFRYFEREYPEAVAGGISLRQPFPRHLLQPEFRREYSRNGWEKATRKLLWKQVFIGRIKSGPISYLWRIPRKLYRMARKLFS